MITDTLGMQKLNDLVDSLNNTNWKNLWGLPG